LSMWIRATALRIWRIARAGNGAVLKTEGG
jgi:hypothetical protein